MLAAVSTLRASVRAAPAAVPAASRAIHVSSASYGPKKREPSDKKRPLTKYNIFVKQTYPIVKAERGDLTRQQLIAEVARLWRRSPENPKAIKA